MSSWVRHFRSRFLTGLLFVLPLVATVWVVNLLFRIIDNILTSNAIRLIDSIDEDAWGLVWLIRLLSLLVVIVVLYLLGLLATNVVGRRLLRAGDRTIARIPLVGGIYAATRQVLDAVGTGHRAAFRRCVLIEYPRRGVWTLAFVTNEGSRAAAGAGEGYVSLFVPTTPNPTSGYFVVMPRADCRPLAMTVEEGVKMIVSAGIVVPPGMAVPADVIERRGADPKEP